MKRNQKKLNIVMIIHENLIYTASAENEKHSDDNRRKFNI